MSNGSEHIDPGEAWRSSGVTDDVVHVHPLGDMFAHRLDESGDCWCGPDARLTICAGKSDRWTYLHRRAGYWADVRDLVAKTRRDGR